MAGISIPYCGTAPSPGEVTWNLDPVLIAALIACAGVYILAMRRWPLSMRGAPSPRIWAFTAGWLVLAASFISPLCNLGVALFSARIGQHMILILAAAPLLVRVLDEILRAAGGPAAEYSREDQSGDDDNDNQRNRGHAFRQRQNGGRLRPLTCHIV